MVKSYLLIKKWKIRGMHRGKLTTLVPIDAANIYLLFESQNYIFAKYIIESQHF